MSRLRKISPAALLVICSSLAIVLILLQLGGIHIAADLAYRHSDEDAKALMAEVLEVLLDSSVAARVACLTVALSPDFFPSNLWPSALDWIETVKARLART